MSKIFAKNNFKKSSCFCKQSLCIRIRNFLKNQPFILRKNVTGLNKGYYEQNIEHPQRNEEKRAALPEIQSVMSFFRSKKKLLSLLVKFVTNYKALIAHSKDFLKLWSRNSIEEMAKTSKFRMDFSQNS